MKFLLFFFVFVFYTYQTFCTDNVSLFSQTKSDTPLELLADETEWDRQNKCVIARGKAKLQKEKNNIKAEEIIGYFDPDNEKRSFDKIVARQNVFIDTSSGQLEGQKATYFVLKEYMTMEGDHIKLTSSKNDQLTTKKLIEYWEKEKKVLAHHGITITHQDQVLTGEKLTAYFEDDPKTNQSALKKALIEGHVIITTPTQRAESDKAFYFPQQNEAILEGNVILTEGKHILKGQWAKTDLKTGRNILRGNLDGKKIPVYGLLTPPTKDKK